MFLQSNVLRMERKEIIREKARIDKIHATLSKHNLSSTRTQKLEQIRKESIEKIKVLSSHSQKLWDEIQTRLNAKNIYQGDIKAFQLRFYDLKTWSYIAENLDDSEDNIKKRLERIAKSTVMISDEKGGV